MELTQECNKINISKYKKKTLPDPIRGLGENKYEQIGNETIFNMVNKLPSTVSLYLYLKHNKSTWDREKYNVGKDKFDLYNKYFKAQGKICASISEGIMSKHFNVDIKTIRRWIQKLEKINFIEIETIKLGKGKKCKTYNIYVLGRLIDGERKYYADVL